MFEKPCLHSANWQPNPDPHDTSRRRRLPRPPRGSAGRGVVAKPTLPVARTQKRHGVWTCPTCKHQPFSPLGIPPILPQQKHQPTSAAASSPRKASAAVGSGATRTPPSPAQQHPGSRENVETASASAFVGENGPRSAIGLREPTPSFSPQKGPWGGEDGHGHPDERNRSASVGSGSGFGDVVGDGGGDNSRRTGRQRVAKSFGDEFDEVRKACVGCGLSRRV